MGRSVLVITSGEGEGEEGGRGRKEEGCSRKVQQPVIVVIRRQGQTGADLSYRGMSICQLSNCLINSLNNCICFV